MNHDEVKRRLLENERVREAYENPPLEFMLARTVVERRKELGLSQEELARAAETSQSQIWRIESGQENLRLDTLHRLERILGFTLELRDRGGGYLPASKRHGGEHGPDRNSVREQVFTFLFD